MKIVQVNRRWGIGIAIGGALTLALVAALTWLAYPDAGLAGVLFVLNQVSLLGMWPVAAILWFSVLRGRGPNSIALLAMAIVITLIAIAITAYVFAVFNSGFQWVSGDIARIVLRGVLLGLALWALWFLWLFLTGKFRDGE